MGKKGSTKKSNHKHLYEPVILRSKIRMTFSNEETYSMWSGSRCTICGKIKLGWMFLEPLPNEAASRMMSNEEIIEKNPELKIINWNYGKGDFTEVYSSGDEGCLLNN